MSGDAVSIAFTAEIGQLQAGANQAAATVASSVGEMTAAAEEGHGAFGRFTEILQHHRMEMRQESGMARVLSRDLAGLGLDARGAGGEIAHLLSAFAMGGAIGGGIAVAKGLIEVVREVCAAVREGATRFRAVIEAGEAAVLSWTLQRSVRRSGRTAAAS